jgi:hypothetical protein
MKKILIVVGILTVVGFMFGSVKADQSGLVRGSDAHYMYVVNTASAQITQKPCTVYALYASSGVETAINWFQVMSTYSAVSNSYVYFTRDSLITPAIPYVSSTTSGTNVYGMPYSQRIMLGGDYGIRISSGLFIYNPAGSSGGAGVVAVEWGF